MTQYMRAIDWMNQVAPPRAYEGQPQTPASQMTIEHLGSTATQADLNQFREWVTELQRRTGMDEQTATDAIWNDGDFYQGAIRAGVHIEE